MTMSRYCSYCRGDRDHDELDPEGRLTLSEHPTLCNSCLVDQLRIEPVFLYTEEDGKHSYAFLCPRCDGSGHYYAGTLVDDSWCFSCGGGGYIVREREIVQQVARWWQTYQRNRVVDSSPTTKRPEES